MKVPQTAEIVKKIAPQIGAKVLLEPEYGFVGKIIFKNGKTTFFSLSKFNINSMGSAAISGDKNHASYFLKQLGYKVTEGQTFFNEALNKNLLLKRTIDDGYEFAKKLGFPVIVKPNDFSQGALVTKVYNKREYYQVAEIIFDKTRVLIVEKFYVGNDYRILVLDDEVIAAYQRIPLFVVGDGKSTISELLHQKEESFAKNCRNVTIKTDDMRIISKLEKQQLSLDGVLPENTKIYLLDNANLSSGGEAIDLTKNIHPDFQKLAINITKDMCLRLCGVDIITSDITQPIQDYVILEINSSPGITQYASIGEQQMKIVEELYLKILQALERD